MSEEPTPLTCPECGSRHESGRFCTPCKASLPQPDKASAPEFGDSPDPRKSLQELQEQLAAALKALVVPASGQTPKPEPAISLGSAGVPPALSTGYAIRAGETSALPDVVMATSRIAGPELNPSPTQSHEPSPQTDCPGEDDCCPVIVEYNKARAFMVGYSSPFGFQIRSRGESLKAVRVRLKDLASPNNPCSETVEWINPGDPRKVKLNFAHANPASPLNVKVEIAVQHKYGAADEWEIYDFSADHIVYPAEVRSSTGGSLTINIDNKGGFLYGDINVGKADPAWALVNKMIADMNAPSQYFPANLRLRPEANPALLLRQGRKTLVLISKETVSFGREKPDSSVKIQVVDKYGEPDGHKNQYISRAHFHIECQGTSCSIYDGVPHPENPNLYKQSTWGTAVNGRKVTDSVYSSIRPGECANVVIARKFGTDGVLNLKLDAVPCQKRQFPNCTRKCPINEVASMWISRNDTDDTAYLLVWKCAPLRDFFEGLPDCQIILDQGLFRLVNRFGRITPLRLGHPLGDDSNPVYVSAYNPR